MNNFQNNVLFLPTWWIRLGRWKINGILEQDALSKFTVDICIRVSVPSKQKRWGMPGIYIYLILSIKWILDRIGRGSPYIIKKVYPIYLMLFEINCHGKLTLRPFMSLVFICNEQQNIFVYSGFFFLDRSHI